MSEQTESQEINQEVQEEQVIPQEVQPEENKEQVWKSKNQRRIDKLVGDNYAKDAKIAALEAKIEAFMQFQPQQQVRQEQLTKDDFPSDEAYIEHLIEKKAEAKLSAFEAKRAKEEKEREAQLSRQQVQQKFIQASQKAMSEYTDYLDVTADLNIATDSELGENIMESDLGPQIMYYLGKNPSIEEKLLSLKGRALAREIGKIEDKLSRPIEKKTTKAPDPITPVSSAGTGKYTGKPDLKKDSGMDFYYKFNKSLYG